MGRLEMIMQFCQDRVMFNLLLEENKGDKASNWTTDHHITSTSSAKKLIDVSFLKVLFLMNFFILMNGSFSVTQPKTNNLVAKFHNWGPNYFIAFDLNINNFHNGWRTLLHFTSTGRSCCGHGDRFPAIFLFNDHLRIKTAWNGNNDYSYFSSLPLAKNIWYRVRIYHIEKFGKV